MKVMIVVEIDDITNETEQPRIENKVVDNAHCAVM
jgi:hypothetical protein